MRVRCPNCQKVVEFGVDLGGTVVRCAWCGRSMLLPGNRRESVAQEGASRAASQLEVQQRPEPPVPPGNGEGSEMEVYREPTTAPALMSIDELRDSGERFAKGVLIGLAVPIWILLALGIVAGIGLPLILLGIIVGIRYIMHLFALAYIKTNAVRVSPGQFPDVHQCARAIFDRLGVPLMDVYILQDSTWNAFATKLAGKRIVVLLSGAIDSILLKGDFKQLQWVVGHEIGHHLAGHFGFAHEMISLGGWFPWVLMWYKRRGEMTCDRIGLYACGDLQACLGALSSMAVGAQLSPRLNVQKAIEQWETHRREFFVRYRTIYSMHPPLLWRFQNLLDSAREFGITGSRAS